MVGLGGLEPPTSRLSSARSNQLSYKPELTAKSAPLKLVTQTPCKTNGFARSERDH